MLKEIQWGRGLMRLWVVATLLWIAVSSYFVVLPHYFTEAPPGPPSVADIQRNVQNQIECLGYVDEKNTTKPWLHWKCASKPVDQDSRLNIHIQNGNTGTLEIVLSDGERITNVPEQVGARDISEKLYRHFADKASSEFRKTFQSDALLVLWASALSACFGIGAFMGVTRFR